MSSLPPVLKAAMALVLLGSIVRAFRGAGADPPRPRLASAFLSVALTAQAGAVLATLAGYVVLAMVMAAAGVEACCLAAWLGWGEQPPPPDGDPGEDVPPWDWGAFDHERRSWDRPRVTV
jgi:hypothetical protein